MNIDSNNLAIVFDEWAKRYAESPEDFTDVLDASGKVLDGYGDQCQVYFMHIYSQLFNKAL